MRIKIMNILLALLFMVLTGCVEGGDGADSSRPASDTPDQSATDQAIPMRSVCLGCHQMNARTAGPSIKELSAKYKTSDISRLVATVKAGRTQDELTWGNTPMPPSFLPEEEIQKAIEWMLTQ
jgi:cytochrome c551/c552